MRADNREVVAALRRHVEPQVDPARVTCDVDDGLGRPDGRGIDLHSAGIRLGHLLAVDGDHAVLAARQVIGDVEAKAANAIILCPGVAQVDLQVLGRRAEHPQ